MPGVTRNSSSIVGKLLWSLSLGARSPVMLRGALLPGILILLPGVLLLGCPLYDEDCSAGQGCARGFQCDRFSQRCVTSVDLPSCTRPEQCAAAETCTPDFVCRPGSCDFHGCVGGFTCGVVEGAHACVPLGQVDAGADAMAAPDLADAASNSDASTNSPNLEPPDASPTDAAVTDAAPDASP